MTIQLLMKRAIQIIKKKQYKIISERMIVVKDQDKKYTVTYQTKPGRTIQTCTCTNYVRHCKQSIRCVHMIVTEWILMFNQINSGGKNETNIKSRNQMSEKEDIRKD